MLVLDQLGPIPEIEFEVSFLQASIAEKDRYLVEEINWCGKNWGDELGSFWDKVSLA